MHFVLLCVVIIVFVEIYEGATICKVPNGDAGTCIEISKCKPLWEVYKKRPKTKEENQYIAQAYCGNPSISKIKVCCPDESTWDGFVVNPVLYERPDNSIEGPGTTTKIKTAPAPTTVEPLVVPLSANPDTVDKKPVKTTVAFKNQNGCGRYISSANKITGGEPTAIDQYPWLVLLEYSGGSLGCGGSLITERFILTAAHCVDGANGIPKTARLAEYNISSYPIDFVEVEGGGLDEIENIFIPVETAMRHPDFSRKTLFHDIGIVKLAQAAVLSDFVKLVCLPTKDYIPVLPNNANFTVAGWGDDPKREEFFDVKKEVTVPFVSMSQCTQTYSTARLSETQICAGGEEGKDTCKGDSGGPLMYDEKQTFVILGVVSYGPRECGTRGQPAVYTHVYKYLDWIADTIQTL